MKVALTLLATFFLVAESRRLKAVSKDEAESYLAQYGYIGRLELAQMKLMQQQGETEPTPIEREAVRHFQQMAGINVTGVLDENTRLKMAQPRCGVSDIQAYVMNAASAKWNKNSLTYMVEAYTSDLTQAVFNQAAQEAFAIWSAVTPLKFTLVKSNADIKIKFGRRRHGDPWPFDGKGNVLAHATLPYSETKGLLHFDDDETWVYKDARKLATLDYTDILTVAVHEIGHVLGLDHSNDAKAIMSAFYKEPTDSRGNYIEPVLGKDDINKIRDLYGSGSGVSSGGTTKKTTTTSKYNTRTPDWVTWWPGWRAPGQRYRTGGAYSAPSAFFPSLNRMFGYP